VAFVKWSSDYSIGVVNIDNQHKRMVSMINRLHKSIPDGAVNSEIDLVLKSLVDYTQYHFAAEEKLMQEIQFPDYQRHRRLHRDLTAQVTDMMVTLEHGKELTVFELITFLKRWLVEHIIKEDRKIGDAVAARVGNAL